MILNETKTKTMLICGKRLGKKLSDQQLQVQLNSVELFNKLNWLPFYYKVKVNMCVLIYKCLNQCPAYMRDIRELTLSIQETTDTVPLTWYAHVIKEKRKAVTHLVLDPQKFGMIYQVS